MVASEPPDREAVKSFHGHCSHETNLGPDEAVFSVPRRRLETAPLYQTDGIKQRGAVMLVTVLSSIYRHFLKAALLGIAATRGMRR